MLVTAKIWYQLQQGEVAISILELYSFYKLSTTDQRLMYGQNLFGRTASKIINISVGISIFMIIYIV